MLTYEHHEIYKLLPGLSQLLGYPWKIYRVHCLSQPLIAIQALLGHEANIPGQSAQGHHWEQMSLLLTWVQELHLLLGFPWFQQHNACIDCLIRSVTIWKPQCKDLCLKSPVKVATPSKDQPDLFMVPSDYHDLQGNFANAKLRSLYMLVKGHHLLLLMNTVFELLQQASIFFQAGPGQHLQSYQSEAGCKWKTSFVRPLVHYEYLVMPFGLLDAPAILQHF